MLATLQRAKDVARLSGNRGQNDLKQFIFKSDVMSYFKVPAPQSLRQGDRELEVSLGYIVSGLLELGEPSNREQSPSAFGRRTRSVNSLLGNVSFVRYSSFSLNSSMMVIHESILMFEISQGEKLTLVCV